jgi:hypothetical protein
MFKSISAPATFAAVGVAILIGIIALAITAVGFAHDPLDRFQVIRVISEPGVGRHAVTYRYNHADSSNQLVGIWILYDPPPEIGSTIAPRSAPAAIWTGTSDRLDQKWLDGHLAISTADIPIVSVQLNDCYFNYDAENVLCLNSNVVEFMQPQRR